MVALECAIGHFPYMQSEDQQSGPSFYELLEAIVESPPPSAPPDQFSPEFCSFISAWYCYGIFIPISLFQLIFLAIVTLSSFTATHEIPFKGLYELGICQDSKMAL